MNLGKRFGEKNDLYNFSLRVKLIGQSIEQLHYENYISAKTGQTLLTIRMYVINCSG